MFAAEAIDALDVITPRETHAAWVDAAADRGIDVLCQKPLTPTLAESEALVRRVAGKSRLMAHENWRFRPWYRELKRWIAAGELGDLVLARMATITSGLLPDASGRRPLLEREPYTQHEERLMIAEVLIHHLDVMRFLCGELRVVAARGARTVPDVVGETVAAIFLETASGAPVEVTGTMAAAGLSGASSGSAWKSSAARRAPRSRTPCCACTVRLRAASITIPRSAIRRASTASSRISSIASKPVRRSRPTPPTISKRCASSNTRTGPQACNACAGNA